MQAFVSLWSADLLNVESAIDELEGRADGFHVDVMDGHYVPGLLFGPDFVAAVCRRTSAPVEVHLMVEEPDRWIEPFAGAGCARIIIHLDSTPNPADTLHAIESRGLSAGIALGVDDPPAVIEPYLDCVDRVLLMGTALGIKGVGFDARGYGRIAALVELRDRVAGRPGVFVDGGIRRETVPGFAQAGADGVIPGSLVCGDPDPASVLDWIHSVRGAALVPDGAGADGRPVLR
jgi:ribulose-phosphate 3-epimerase